MKVGVEPTNLEIAGITDIESKTTEDVSIITARQHIQNGKSNSNIEQLVIESIQRKCLENSVKRRISKNFLARSKSHAHIPSFDRQNTLKKISDTTEGGEDDGGGGEGHEIILHDSHGRKKTLSSLVITQDWEAIPKPPASLYTYAILFCLREGQLGKLSKTYYESIFDQMYAFFIIVPQLAIVGFVQFVILQELWKSLPYLEASPYCVEWNPKMFFAVVLAFVAALMPSLYDFLTDAKIAFLGKFFYVNGGEFNLQGTFNMRTRPVTSLLPILIVCYELSIWIGVMIVGVYYIITAEDIGAIVQASVAIVFVNEIDNMAFWILDNENDDDDYGKVMYTRLIQKETQKAVRTILGIPIVSAIVCVVIFSLHSRYCAGALSGSSPTSTQPPV